MIENRKKQLMNMQNVLQKLEINMRNYKKENNQLKIELHRYQTYVQNTPQRSNQKPSYTKPIRKRKHYCYDEPEQSEESNSYVTEIRRRPKKQRKIIKYEDEIDGLPEYEPDSPTDE